MQSLVKESMFTFFIRLLIMAIVLSTNIILSRVLGPSAKGSFDLYLLVLTIASLLVIPSIGASNVYYGARTPAKIPLLYTNSIVAAILFALLSIALIETTFFFPSIKLYFYKNNVELFWLHILLLFLPVLIIKNFLTEIIRAVGNIRRYNYIFLGEKIIFLASIVILLGISNLTLRRTLCVWLLSMLAASIVVILFTKSYAKNKYSLDLPQLRKSLFFSLRLHPGTAKGLQGHRQEL